MHTPQEILERVTDIVDTAEAAFGAKFAQWGKHKHSSAAEYFLWTYTETIRSMRLIRREIYNHDAAKFEADFGNLFQRAVGLLDQALEHTKVVKYELRPVHKKLSESVQRINEIPDIGNHGLSLHQIRMCISLDEIRPPNRAAWIKGGRDLKPSKEFEGIYRGFCNLKRDPQCTQTQHEIYATASWRLLQSALRALHLPGAEVYPEDDFFDNDGRWTFVDYPYGSKEFLYGRDGRRGMLNLKEKLGGVITNSQRKELEAANHAIAMGAMVYLGEKKGKRTGKSKGNDKGMGKEKGEVTPKSKAKDKTANKDKDKNKKKAKEDKASKKNKQHPSNSSGPKPKKQKTWDEEYTMNIVNAAADVEDCLRDSKFTELGWEDDVERPGPERLLTPTVEQRRTMLVAYHEDLRIIVDEIYKRRFGTPTSRSKLPQTADERKAWLASADKELGWARASVHNYIHSANSPTKAKQLRLGAYKLKLVRSMYTIGLLSGQPQASAKEIKAGLIGRLDDWILHERAWNSAELFVRGRPGLTRETYDLISDQIKERKRNMLLWGRMRHHLEEGTASEPVAKLDDFIASLGAGDGDEDEKEDEDVFGTEQEEEQGGYEDGEEEIEEHKDPNDDEQQDVVPSKNVGTDSHKAQEEDEGDNGTQAPGPYDGHDVDSAASNDGVQNESVAAESEVAGDPFYTQLTDREIINGRILLGNVLQPKRPNAGNYVLDWREERRQREWYEQAAQSTLANLDLPPWNHGRVIDPFEAGGPPNYSKLPRETVWERLQYMLVLTYWRFYQLRLMEP